MKKMLRRAAVTVAATGMAVAGGVVAAQPAHAYNCRVITAQDMRHFASSSGDALSYPSHLYNGQVFRSYGVTNGRFSISAYAKDRNGNYLGVYASGWLSANGDYSDQIGGGC